MPGARAGRRGAHRRKRERKPCEGMMLHQDGSRAVSHQACCQGEAARDRESHFRRLRHAELS
jgi:hypothetical protein